MSEIKSKVVVGDQFARFVWFEPDTNNCIGYIESDSTVHVEDMR